MSRRLYPHNRVRYWYAYELEEICALFSDKGLHVQTVRKWIVNTGLKTIDSGKPVLVYGQDLIDYLKRHNAQGKSHTKFHEFFCMRCRDARAVFQNKVRLEPESRFIKLCGLCCSCRTPIFKSYKLKDYSAIKRVFRVVDVLELYDCTTCTDRTQIQAQDPKQPYESAQGELFHV